jgi:hypothetical protein
VSKPLIFAPRHLKRAREIVQDAGSIVGNMGQMRHNVARLVAAALAEGERNSRIDAEVSDCRFPPQDYPK